MSKELTVLRPLAPKYKVNDIVYPLASAKRGFIEPVVIYDVMYVPAKGTYFYSFKKDIRNPFLSDGSPNLLPVRLAESDIITFCEAQEIQLDSVNADYAQAVKLFNEACPTGVLKYSQPNPTADKFGSIQPPAPRFGYNEVVYLMESATAIGRLEAFKISSFRWDTANSEWVYFIDIHSRLERSLTVVSDNAKNYSIPYHETELGTFCEAQSQVVQYLAAFALKAKFRKTQNCPELTSVE